MKKFKSLFECFYNSKIDFFTGVPDSLLSDFSKELEANKKKIKHIIAPNEGNALAIAIGSFITTNNLGVVYLQNSGLGNLINPYFSLADENVWKTPVFLVIGWRGSPNSNDEPQHLSQGKATLKILKLLNIKYEIIADNHSYEKKIRELKKHALKFYRPVAIIFSKKYNSKAKNLSPITIKQDSKISRTQALISIIKNIKKNDLVISTTGKTSRELYLIRKNKKLKLDDLFVVGGMGHASSIALGIMESIRNKNIFLLDGDGAFLMHMGILSLTAKQKNNTFFHILLNNNCHDSVGGQPTSISNIDLKLLSNAFGYGYYKELRSLKQIDSFFSKSSKKKSSTLINVKITKGSLPDLPRPKETPLHNLKVFRKKINYKGI